MNETIIDCIFKVFIMQGTSNEYGNIKLCVYHGPLYDLGEISPTIPNVYHDETT